jgi:hypothetical protein
MSCKEWIYNGDSQIGDIEAGSQPSCKTDRTLALHSYIYAVCVEYMDM